MTVSAADPGFGEAVDAALAAFLQAQRERLLPLGPDLAELLDVAGAFVSGGKRLRPLFCRAGWIAAGGDPADERIAVAAAALEWLQASALVHDDLIDASDTRRGRPSVHRDFEARMSARAGTGDPARFGASTAILLGDLMLSWADEMLRTSFPAAQDAGRLGAAFRILDLCKTEVAAGQFLDVVAQTRTELSVGDAMTVVTYKSAKYTVERPLHLGAALAGGSDDLMVALSAVALPLGAAFQLRDDVLGVFGDPVVTGKPAGDDLREGKRTVLIARAAELTDDTGREHIGALLGTADGVERLSALIRDCGALEAVELDIARLEAEADAAIAALGPAGRSVLGPLALTATRRTR